MPLFIDLTPNLPDGGEFISVSIKVQYDAPISIQTYAGADFSVEGTNDGSAFWPIVRYIDTPPIGLRSFTPNASEIRVRAVVAGIAPYALFCYTPPLDAGTLLPGAETPVSSVAVAVLAANASRLTGIIQNVGSANIRVGPAGVTATTGTQLTPGATMIFDTPGIVADAIFAIREGAVDSIALGQEVVVA